MWIDTELATLADTALSASERTLLNAVTTTASQNTISYGDALKFDPTMYLATDRGWRNMSPYVITESKPHDYIDDLREMLAQTDLGDLIRSIGADIKIGSDNIFITQESPDEDCDTSGVEEFLEGIEVVRD